MTRLALAALLMLAASCAPPAVTRTADPNAPIVLMYPTAGEGEIRLTVRPRYATGAPVVVEIDVRAGTIAIRGPLAGRVAESELGGERVIRHLPDAELRPVDAPRGSRASTTTSWDARTDEGAFVGPATYSLTLDFAVGDATQRVGTVLELRPP